MNGPRQRWIIGTRQRAPGQRARRLRARGGQTLARIFLSYRREDASGTSGRLADTLVQRFGVEQVFRDVETLQAGERFEQAIFDAVRASGAVLVVIGPRWLAARKPDGTRRLDDPDDFVRREVEASLAADAVIVPVLVEDARMPGAAELPESLRALAERQAFALTDAGWQDDCERLVRALQESAGIEFGLPQDNGARRSSASEALASVTTYLPDLLALLAQPRRVLALKSDGRRAGLARALGFLVLSLLLGHLILWSAMGDMMEQSLAAFLFNGFAFGMLAALLASGVLYAAWRAVGAPPGYARIGIVFSYQAGVVALGLLLALAIFVFALVWHDIGLPERIRAITAGSRDAQSTIGVIAKQLSRGEASRAGIVGLLIMLALMVCLAAWFLVSWGAYARALGASFARSVVAFGLFCLLVWLPIGATGWLARLLSG